MNYLVDSAHYKEPLFRPPSEWDSLLIPVTNGCTHSCTFCSMYRSKNFSMRKDIDGIKRDIDLAKSYGNKIRKIFLLDGNAFVVKADMLAEITRYCYNAHPNLKRVTAYAHAKDIVRKTDEDLKRIAEAGFSMVYVGVESGDNDVLKFCSKGTTHEELALAAQKCHKAGISWSGIFLLGLAGNDPELSRKHAVESGKLITKMAPPKDNPVEWYVAPLTLSVTPGTPLWEKKKAGEFKECSSTEILREMRIMIEHTSNDIQNCVFRTNHASNYLNLSGVLSRDKEKLMTLIQYGIDNPRVRRPDFLRGL